MRVKSIIRGEKTVTDWGEWKSGQKMPGTLFPLSKGHSFRVRGCYNWRLVKFNCLDHEFRLLIFFRLDKQEFDAWLGQQDGNDTKVIVRLEYHATHPGWHVHTNCETNDTPSGRTGGKAHRQRIGRKDKNFSVTDDSKALYMALKSFGVVDNQLDMPRVTQD